MKNKKQKGWGAAVERMMSSPGKGFLIILGVTIAGYSNILANGLVLNDYNLLFQWDLIRNLNNVYVFFFRFVPPDSLAGVYAPLRVFLVALSSKIYDVNIVGYHFFSLGVHLLSTVFVVFLTHRLTADRKVSFLTGLLFALHPANSASIAYFTASTAAVGTTLALASFLFYVRSVNFSCSLADGRPMPRVEDEEDEDEENLGLLWIRKVGVRPNDYILSFILAAAAVLTCGQTAVLPVLILWLDATFHRTEEGFRVRVLRALPFFAVTAWYLLMKKAVLGAVFSSGYIADSFYLNALAALKSCLQYMRFSLLPWPLALRTELSAGIFSSGLRDFKEGAFLSQSIFEPRVVLAVALIAAIFFFSVKKRKETPLFMFCAGWFFIALLPKLSLLPQTVLFSLEHLYLGLFAFCLMAAFFLIRAAERVQSAAGKRMIGAAAVLMIMLYGWGTFLNNQTYLDNGRLMLKAVRDTPQIPSLRHDLGVLLAQDGQAEEALKQFTKAAELDPQEPQYHFAAAGMFAQMEQREKAIAQLKRAVELEPRFAEAYFNLASLYALDEDMDAVVKNLNLARDAFIEQKRFVEAAEFLSAAGIFFRPPESEEKNNSKDDQ